MFGNNVASSGLTFGKVLSGISKTLSIANQVIPLYQKTKPMVNNAKTIISVIKGLNSSKPLKNKLNAKQTTSKLEVIKKNNNQVINKPIFFQ